MTPAQYETELLERREFLRRVRSYMRDFPELNTLIDGTENDDEMLLDTLDLVLDDINSMPPPIGAFFLQHLPLGLVQDAMISRLLESAAILLARNDLSFTTGGVTVQFNQYQAYLQLSSMMYQRYQQGISRWKIALNHQLAVSASAGVGSDWALLYRPSRYFYRSAFSSSFSYDALGS